MKVSARFFGIVVTLAACAIDPAVHFGHLISKRYAVLLASAVALLLWAVRALRAADSRLRLTAIEVTLLASILWSVVTNPAGLATQGATWFWLPLAAVLLTLVVRQLFNPPTPEVGADGVPTRIVAVADLMTALWIVGSALAIHGLATAIAAGGFHPAGLPEKTAVVSVLGLPNAFGAVMAAGIIGAMVSVAAADRRSWRLLLVGAALLQLVALFGNGSRGALLGLMAGGLVVLWLRGLLRSTGRVTANERAKASGRFHGFRPLISGLAVLVAVAGAGFVLHRMDPGSGRGRLMAWEVSGAMLSNRMLTGVGAGRFGAEWGQYQAELWRHQAYAEFDRQAVQRAQPNSELLHRLAERGLPGGALYVLLWVLALGFLVRGLRRNDRTSPVEWGLLALLIAILMHSFVDGVFRWVPTLVIAHLAFGVIPAPVVVSADLRPARARRLAMAVAVAWAAIVALKTLREYPGYMRWREARRAAGTERMDLLERAQRRLPWEQAIDHELGLGLLEAGRLEEAVNVLQRGVDAENDPETRLALAEAQLELGWLAPAEENARGVAAEYPDRLGPRLVLARIHFASGEDAQARVALASCIRRDTWFRSAAVDSVATEAALLWQKWYDDDPPR